MPRFTLFIFRKYDLQSSEMDMYQCQGNTGANMHLKTHQHRKLTKWCIKLLYYHINNNYY